MAGTFKSYNSVVMQIDVKCIFQGQDGSLGYRTGREYDLELIFSPRKGQPTRVVIFPNGNQIPCPYESFTSFLKNWGNVRFLKNPKLGEFFTRIEFTGNIIQYTVMIYKEPFKGMGPKRNAFVFLDAKAHVKVPILISDFPVKKYDAASGFTLYEFVFQGDIRRYPDIMACLKLT